MPKASFITLHLARFDALLKNPGITNPARADGVLFCEVAADTRGAGTEPISQQAFIFALVALHADEGSARTLFDQRRALVPWMDDAKETWSGVLRPFRHKGELNWLDRDSPGLAFDVGASPAADAPLVLITSAGFNVGPQLDMNRVKDFGTGVVGVRASMTAVPGLRSQESFLFPGALVHDAWTLTFWENDAAVRAFAYGGGVHKMQMDRYREQNTADRSSFTRAVALDTRGSWHGGDPLRT